MQCYIIDAFSDKIFGGNPAAVCVLERWLEDSLMQKIASEHNLSETAFCVPSGAKGTRDESAKTYQLRWFTPANEIELCGHATLATGFVVLNLLDLTQDSLQRNAPTEVAFETKSGILKVHKIGDRYEIDLPSFALTQLELTQERAQKIEEAIGFKPLEVYLGRDLVCVLENENQVRECNPNFSKVLRLEGVLCHITARGDCTKSESPKGAKPAESTESMQSAQPTQPPQSPINFDCVSRSFAPKHGVDEDPVCGSGHCHLVPLWSKKLGKAQILAYQASKRGGVLLCEDRGERVSLAGNAVLYSRNHIML